ncbi:MAG: CapA family protein [Ruminococcaceae bacterium]|nr:CapA family protein [Oscillospiraceae bacterium]
MKKAIIISVIIWVLLLSFGAAVPFYILSRELPETPGLVITETMGTPASDYSLMPSDAHEELPPDPVYITLSFIGDCMLATDRGGEWDLAFNKLAKEVEPSYFFENVAGVLAEDDWTIANLENVFTDNPNARMRAKAYRPAYWYKSPTANTAILNEGSVEVVSLANNHSLDYGDIGYEDTRTALEDAGILWGDDENILILEKEGFTIALYLCTFYNSYYDVSIMEKMAAVEADYKIVYFHGGTERVHEPDYWKAAGARRMIDSGIDFVVGGHPHVLQPIEIYNGKTIVHSLGNFVFGGSRNEENRTIIYRRTLKLLEGEIVDITDEIIPCYVYTDLYQPDIITDQAEIDAVMAFLRGETESPLS